MELPGAQTELVAWEPVGCTGKVKVNVVGAAETLKVKKTLRETTKTSERLTMFKKHLGNALGQRFYTG